MNIQGKVAVTGRGSHRGMSVGNLSWEVCWVLYWVAVFETGPPQNTVREDKALPWITRFDLHILRFPIWKLWLCMHSPPFCTAVCYVKPVLPFGKDGMHDRLGFQVSTRAVLPTPCDTDFSK